MTNVYGTKTRGVLLIVLGIATLLSIESPANDKKSRAQTGSLIKESLQQFTAGQYDTSLALLDRAQKLDPNNQDAYYYMALTHTALSDTSQAIACLIEGIERVPLSSQLKLFLTRLFIAEGKYEEAEKLLETVFRFMPHHAEALYLKGLVNVAQGDSTAALESWQDALENFYAREKIR